MLSQMEVQGKDYGIFTTHFIFTTKKTFSNPKWTYTKSGQNEYREEFFEDILKIAHQKCGKDFWKMSHQKYEEEDCRKQKAPRGVSL